MLVGNMLRNSSWIRSAILAKVLPSESTCHKGREWRIWANYDSWEMLLKYYFIFRMHSKADIFQVVSNHIFRKWKMKHHELGTSLLDEDLLLYGPFLQSSLLDYFGCVLFYKFSRIYIPHSFSSVKWLLWPNVKCLQQTQVLSNFL